jgi:hypothetical protein
MGPMRKRLRETGLPRLLFVLTAAAALGLLLAVVFAPLVDEGPAAEGPRLVSLFARDAVVRRTAVASGLGLLVTACVFFRPTPSSKDSKSSRRRPPDTAAGA